MSAVKYYNAMRISAINILRRRSELLYNATQGLLLVGCLSAAVLMSTRADWSPLELVGLLLVLSVLGERLELTVGSQSLSAGFVALVLAMTLLGPAPAVAIAIVAISADSLSRRPSPAVCLSNAATYVAFALLGGVLVRISVGNVHDQAVQATTRSVTFALVVFGAFLITNVVNFALIAIQKRVLLGRGLVTQVRTLLVPMLPGQFAAAILAAILAVAYTNLGYPALVGVVVVILIFQYLARALLRSEDRAEQLEARSVRLASMQLGVLVTLVETLALRDRMTARHAAAVARYSRALAREMGCDEADQDLAHTAGLLHDIGKFALPDRILHAEILSDEDWAVVRRHPQEGATLVGRLDGYGPVADAILYHHESVDGSGYPAGLIGNEIPLASRILAVCNVYDTLTARDSYRSPMTPQDAIAELRRVAGRQLDAEIVDAFIAMLEHDGPVTFAHGDDADFEAELAFERRARALAAPAAR
ncbi:MAG TPA: HD-GYP domain-containing protein [Solirubrobacteraceae bacterium]|jgi:putative nucleotidyltransferase with HDIG domain|nr:HD-GYP domain-containing protein [Solirubrobacteraceae bacterium]